MNKLRGSKIFDLSVQGFGMEDKMKKIVMNFGKLIEDVTIGLGEKGVGKCVGFLIHEPVVPEELKKMLADEEEETDQEM